MRASRGMGAINPTKIPALKKRRDNPNEFIEFRKGGMVKTKKAK